MECNKFIFCFYLTRNRTSGGVGSMMTPSVSKMAVSEAPLVAMTLVKYRCPGVKVKRSPVTHVVVSESRVTQSLRGKAIRYVLVLYTVY